MEVWLWYDEQVEVTREHNSDDEWDGDDLARSQDWDDATLEWSDRRGYYECEEVDFPVAVGDELIAVIARYSTGDSFHQETGCFDVMAVFKTPEKAEACRRACEAAKGYHVTFETESGKKVREYASWNGYFDRLEYVELVYFTVRKS